MVTSFDPTALAPDTGADLYHLTVEGFPAAHFRVESFAGRETISKPYSFDVVVTAESTSDEEIERLALGQRACLVWNVGSHERAFYGVVANARLERVHEAGTRSVQYHLRFVPRLWLLKRRRRTRIFQQMRVPEIIDAVLREAGIAAQFQLLREYPVREYATQYAESDLRFIQRLAAEAGMFFHFVQGVPLDAASAAAGVVPGDTLVFGDDASCYPAVGGGEPATLYFLKSEETAVSHADKITRFVARSVVKATSTAYRDYDPERPMAHLGSSVSSAQPQVGDGGAVAAFTGAISAAAGLELEIYEHHGPFLFPKWNWAAEEAALMLRQKRRRAFTAQGESGCPSLSPGYRFTLAEHPAAHLDRTWVVTSVEHRGHRHADRQHKVFWSTFACAPAEVTFIPPRPKQETVIPALTATVVGPPDEEIHVDSMGRIKVQFHWDREGGYDDRSSCWIRTTHPFAGTGWGVQFIPRVGQEVLVVFDGGDPDKPIVSSALYNGTHPTPFALPGDKTRSGIKTQSSPGGGGSNEISFQDAAGREQIYVHAQRNLDEVVEKNHTLLVRADEFIRVLGSRMDTVEKSLAELVKGDHTSQVDGNRIAVVTGNSNERVSGMLVTRIEGKERRDVAKNADLNYAEDITTRVKGCMTTIVGKADAKRSWQTHAEGTAKLSSLEATEVSSEHELTLRVGKSAIRITSEQIEIHSPAVIVKGKGGGMSADDDGLRISSKGDAQVLVEKKLVMKSKDGASLSMQKEVKVDGSQILLNSPEQAKDPPPKDPDPPTKIVFRDHEGTPLAYQRFLVTMADGGEVSGMTDADGEAEIDLKSGGKVTFPDLSEAK